MTKNKKGNYTSNVDKWYIYNSEMHGKLSAGLHLGTPHTIVLWYDDYLSYVDGCLDNAITPQDEE